METKKLYSLHKISNYVGGDKKEILEMITLFLETIPKDINQLPDLADKGEWESIYKITHKVKPSFDVFAMDEIHAKIRNIELLAHDNDSGGNLVLCIQELMEKTKIVFLQLQAELKDS